VAQARKQDTKSFRPPFEYLKRPQAISAKQQVKIALCTHLNGRGTTAHEVSTDPPAQWMHEQLISLCHEKT
jgi:hypothetical protein